MASCQCVDIELELPVRWVTVIVAQSKCAVTDK
jgi:hypothetical protein